MDTADRRESLEIGKREHRRALDHPVDQQRVALRIDLGDAAVMPLEVQVGRRDGSVEILVRRAGRSHTARLSLRLFGWRPLSEGPARLAPYFARV
jgi:hypothetical protein